MFLKPRLKFTARRRSARNNEARVFKARAFVTDAVANWETALLACPAFAEELGDGAYEGTRGLGDGLLP